MPLSRRSDVNAPTQTAPTLKAPTWDANLYLKFVDARLRPALDLMGRLDPANATRPGHAIYDLGCGAGNISRILAEKFPGAPVVGIDSSEEMLAKARSQTTDPRVTFSKGDLRQFKPDVPPGILYSNAAYQWVENHIDYFPGLLKLLPSGGQLAIQMPRNHEAPSHALMKQAATMGPWRDKLAKVGGIRSVWELARYYDVLKPLCSDLDVWETIYQQVLTGKDPVAQYTAGTGLRPYMAVLDEAERTGFYDTYAKLLAEAYPMRSDGITLFPFRRLFIVARRA
jgi:trans-aconitate 2-methyltransferase